MNLIAREGEGGWEIGRGTGGGGWAVCWGLEEARRRWRIGEMSGIGKSWWDEGERLVVGGGGGEEGKREGRGRHGREQRSIQSSEGGILP